ncbi:MAG: glucokinase [Betaproteobacteria bacterium RIFCSPLOWO2_12_FULL_62_58]|nr:MAG: glucokinase [Betaproteobacteria bacterium RIFCSPLOWO2_12_FULL_62_58]
MILAGDIGATKVLLEAGALQRGRWRTAFGKRYASADHADFGNVLQAFLAELAAPRRAPLKITRACFGVAGPVVGNRVQMTNLPWLVDGDAIAARFGIARVRVVNDFAAAAAGIELLQPADLVTLQPGEPVPGAARVVIGAGTGLGVAYMIRAAGGWRVIAGEAGHAGFAPAAPEQVDLWRDLYSREGRVAAEDVVSGPGLVHIYDFLRRRESGPPLPAGAAAAAISHAALELGDPLCSRALDLFVSCFGAVAGDHALAVMARGGVYLTGGIAPKILPRLASGGFCAAFNAKGVHSGAVRKIPVIAVTDEKLGLLGAALIAGAR